MPRARRITTVVAAIAFASIIWGSVDTAQALGFRRANRAVAAYPTSSCDPCCDTVKQTLRVCHPCTGCTVCVDVCLPACCTGCPKVFSRRTLFGCGLVRYDWCCGHSVVLRFTRCGDVRVIYR